MSEQEESLKCSYGLVAFLDILGYRQIIANNGIKEAALIVRRVLKKVTDFETTASEVNRQLAFSPETRYLAFSDSILVYTNYSQDEKNRRTQAALFAAGCAGLCIELFTEGLPVRGAIASGEFFVEAACFAGKAIVEAYEFANALELSCCVIVPTAEAEFVGVSDPLKLLFPHSVPMKGNQKQKLYTLNLCFSLLVKGSEDPRQFTIEQFSRHSKNINPDVIAKLNNTIHFLEKARAAMKKKIKKNL
jgi:hypothetical protein